MPYTRPPVYFSNRGNMSVSLSTEELHNKENSTFSLAILSLEFHSAAFAFAYTISFLSNLRVIYIIYNRFPKRTQSNFSAIVLVAHLSLICIGITMLSMLNTFQSQELLSSMEPLFRPISDFLEGKFNFIRLLKGSSFVF